MTVRRLVAVILVMTLALPALAARGDYATAGKDWTFSITPNSWLNKYHLDIGGTNLGNTLNDLATGTNASLLVVATAHWRRWAFAFDGVVNSADQNTRVGNTDVRLNLSQTMFQPHVGYKLLDTRNPRGDGGQALWVNLGARYWDIENHIGWTYTPSGSDPTPEQGNLNLDDSWWDALVGVGAHFQFAENMYGYARGNVGGFGLASSSSFTWDLSFLFCYHLNRSVGFQGGYQLISFERTMSTGFTEITNNQLTEGLFVGVSLVF